MNIDMHQSYAIETVQIYVTVHLVGVKDMITSQFSINNEPLLITNRIAGGKRNNENRNKRNNCNSGLLYEHS